MNDLESIRARAEAAAEWDAMVRSLNGPGHSYTCTTSGLLAADVFALLDRVAELEAEALEGWKQAAE